MVPPRSCARTSPSACSQRKRADDLDQQFYENYVCGAERNFGDKRKLDELIDGQSIEPDREKPDKSSGRSKGGWPNTTSARSSSMPVNLLPKHIDQPVVLPAMLVNRAELVATGPEHGTRSVLERGDCGFGLKARIDQVFGQGAYDAIAPGKNLRNLLLMLTCGFQYATSRG